MRREERSGAEIPEDNYIASDDDVGDFKLFVGLDEWRQLVVRAGRQTGRSVGRCVCRLFGVVDQGKYCISKAGKMRFI